MKRACAARGEHKAWGVSPRTAPEKYEEDREAGGSLIRLSPASQAFIRTLSRADAQGFTLARASHA